MPHEDADLTGSPPERVSLTLLEGLLGSLNAAADPAESVAAAVEAVRTGVGADAAFWHSRTPAQLPRVRGETSFTPEQCAQFARKLLAAVPAAATETEFRWLKPERDAGDGQPTAAVVARAGPGGGCVVALSFQPGKRFTSQDEAVARVALKMLIGFRARAHAATKTLLNGLIHTLTAILDAKDPYTAGHSERVARIAALIGAQLGLPPAAAADLFLAGLLHDIGKIGTRDEVLLKQGKLTDAEYEEIKAHPVVGDHIVGTIEPFRRLRPAVRHHHERYDGSGYPDKLAGEAIPFAGRVLAVADALDAMMSPRRYRPAKSPPEIDAILRRESGRQFDPAVVEAFLAIRNQIYPPIFQKGIGESAYHAIDEIIDNAPTHLLRPLPPPAGGG